MKLCDKLNLKVKPVWTTLQSNPGWTSVNLDRLDLDRLAPSTTCIITANSNWSSLDEIMSYAGQKKL